MKISDSRVILHARGNAKIANEIRAAAETVGAGYIEISQTALRRIVNKIPRRGLGDLVAAVAQPIARVIDAAAGTKIAECGGCKKRREMLNRIRF